MVVLAIRASDGSAWSLTRPDFDNIHSLDQLFTNLLSPLLTIPPEDIICMNEEGAVLRDESLPLLLMKAAEPEPSSASIPGGGAGGASQELSRPSARGTANGNGSATPPIVTREMRLFIFDRSHLDLDPETVSAALAVAEEEVLTEPELSPEDPLESHVDLSAFNLTRLRALIHSISLQRASLGLALSNLARVNTGNATKLSQYRATSAPNIQSWSQLLEGWEANMEAIAKVAVVSGLLGKGSSAGPGAAPVGHNREGSTASNAGVKEKERYLGDYVSPEKMLTVKEGCAKVLNDLRTREDALQAIMDGVLAGTAQVSDDFEATSRDLEDLEACDHDAVQGHLRIEELVRNASELTDPDLRAECFEELSAIDAESRDRIRFLIERKNAMTRYLVNEMQRISNLQSDVYSIPPSLAELDHDRRTKTDNFKHIARLEGLIPAYVATVVEVVRRREFARQVNDHSQALLTSTANLSTTERDRRKHYRNNFSGKLPWEVRGLAAGSDEKVPEIDFSVHNLGGDLPELKRDTLEGLRKMLADLEPADSDKTGETPFKKAGNILDGLIGELEELDREFESLAHGQPVTSPSPPADPSTALVQELEGQVRSLEEAREDLERLLQAERGTREEELAQLNQTNGELIAAREQDAGVAQGLRERLSAFQNERNAWERERGDWSRERRESKDLLDEVVKRANGAATELRQSANRHAELDRQVSTTQSLLSELQKKSEESEAECSSLRSELESTREELSQAKSSVAEMENSVRTSETRQKELLAVVADKDRLLRDERAESELDRAVLDKELADLRRTAAGREADLQMAMARNKNLEEIATGLREQIARWERTAAEKERFIGEVKTEAEEAKREKEVTIVTVQRELEQVKKIARSSLKFAGRLRDENNQIVAVLSAVPISKSDSSDNNNVDKAASAVAGPSSSPRDASPVSAPPPLDYDAGNLEELLAAVQKYDFDALNGAVRAKVETLTAITKKWSKEAKSYREKAHRAAGSASDKIAFRNFAKGDLALFLPTRNSAVPVWAAFNVSFPHHFLSATGQISEQMKSREWIVARITSLTEKVVDAKDPTSNPYLLAPGTKFFLLEVEPFSSKDGGSRSRKHSSTDKVRSPRPEERRSHSTGHIRESRSESSVAMTPALSASTVIVSSAEVRKASGISLPSNATDLARSEFAIVEDPDEADEDVISRPPSPTTLKQPVPRSDEPFGPSPPTPASALARALARSAPAPDSPSSISHSNQSPRRPSDPFSAGPFASGISDAIIISPPATDFEPTATSSGAVPAFLPSRKSPSSTLKIANSSSKPKFDVGGSSPISASGSFMPRSASSGSSILSGSIHRRAGAGFTSGSPPTTATKATATAQASDSRWKTLTDDLESIPQAEVMTANRQSVGWPARAGGSDLNTRGKNGSSSSLFDSFISGRKSTATPDPQPTGSLAKVGDYEASKGWKMILLQL